MKTLATLACLAALSSLMLLALVRGDVLAQAARSAAAVVTFTQDSTPAPAPVENGFYDRTLCLLRLLMALLALAIEIGAGLALFEARRLGAVSGDDPAPIIEVHVLGVDGAGKDIAYWQTLRDFWTAYFKKAGANLKTYTVLRELPSLSQ